MIGKTITGGAPAAFACLCLATAGVASGQDVFNIDEPSDLAEIDGTDTLNILDGGEVGETYDANLNQDGPNLGITFRALDNSTVNVFDGGYLGQSIFSGSSTLNINGGRADSFFGITLRDEASAFLTDGSVVGALTGFYARDRSTFTASNASIGSFFAYDSSNVTLRNIQPGTDADAYGGNIGPGATLLLEQSTFWNLNIEGTAIIRDTLIELTDLHGATQGITVSGTATVENSSAYFLDVEGGTADVRGGALVEVTVEDGGVASISEGTVVGQLDIIGGTVEIGENVLLGGGDLGDFNVEVTEGGMLILRGGDFSAATFSIADDSTFLLGGSGFSLDGVDINVEAFTEDDPFVIDERGGALLAGTLLDGTSFELALNGSFADGATIGLFGLGLTAIPSPTAAGTGLALFGLLGLKRRRNLS